MSHFSVNSVRPITVYILGVLAICCFGWAIAENIIVVPYGINSPYPRQTALGMFAIAALFGVATILKNAQRSEKPWSVTRAQVNRYYALFIVVTFCAILAAK